MDGKKFRRIRQDKGYIQLDITLRTGIHQSKISNFERGYLTPNKDERKRLAKALGIKASDLD